SEAAARSFNPRVENPPHVVRGRHVFHFEIADLGVHHHFRGGRNAAIVQVDDVAIHGKGMPDVKPEIFVPGDRVGRTAGDGRGGRLRSSDRVILKGGEYARGGSQETATLHRVMIGEVRRKSKPGMPTISPEAST